MMRRHFKRDGKIRVWCQASSQTDLGTRLKQNKQFYAHPHPRPWTSLASSDVTSPAKIDGKFCRSVPSLLRSPTYRTGLMTTLK